MQLHRPSPLERARSIRLMSVLLALMIIERLVRAVIDLAIDGVSGETIGVVLLGLLWSIVIVFMAFHAHRLCQELADSKTITDR